jgi:hypothetical protein
MLFMLASRTRPGLAPADYGELATLAKQFYASIPPGVNIRGEWAAEDRSINYTLLEAPDMEVVRHIQEPFARFTDTSVVPVVTIKGWTVS